MTADNKGSLSRAVFMKSFFSFQILISALSENSHGTCKKKYFFIPMFGTTVEESNKFAFSGRVCYIYTTKIKKANRITIL
jgi:hypothetical protein